MHNKSSNRSFGLLFFVVFLAIGLWPLTKNISPNYYLIAISIIFLFLGILNAKILSPLNNVWIKFGEMLGKIIAPIVPKYNSRPPEAKLTFRGRIHTRKGPF